MTIMKESHCSKHISHVLKQNPVRWCFNQCEPHHTFKPKEFPACTPLSPPSLIRIGSSAWILLRIGWSNDLLGFHECRASMNVVYIVSVEVGPRWNILSTSVHLVIFTRRSSFSFLLGVLGGRLGSLAALDLPRSSLDERCLFPLRVEFVDSFCDLCLI